MAAVNRHVNGPASSAKAVDISQLHVVQARDLGWDLAHPVAKVRLRAARALAEHPEGHTEVDGLVHALDDEDAAVREAASDAFDWILMTRPEILAALVQRARDDESPSSLGLARYLVHVGTPEAIEAALPVVAGDAMGDEREALLGALVAADPLSNEQLAALMGDADEQEPDLRRLAAEILGRRGVADGYRVLFGEFGSRSLYNDYIDRGEAGIRALCCAFPERDIAHEDVAERLAARRKKTEPVVCALAVGSASAGARTALETLGYWDDPRAIAILLKVAEDPSRDRELRDQAMRSLCRLEAPEAMELMIRTLLDTDRADCLRWDCATALGAIGKPEALDALACAATSDPDEWVREYAQEALESIQLLMAA